MGRGLIVIMGGSVTELACMHAAATTGWNAVVLGRRLGLNPAVYGRCSPARDVGLVMG
jgi:hypothetical protein